MSIDIIAADWPATGVVAGTTTRPGGISSGVYATLNLAAHVGDDREAVVENRRRLTSRLRMPAEPRWLHQVHGISVVDAGDPEFASAPPHADAVVSHSGRDVLGILTADCVPILLSSTSRAELAAVHAGWRSLSGGIVAETIARLDSEACELLAWLGPAISQAAFEVGDDVRDIFLAGVEDAAACFEPNDRDRWQADIYGLATRYLAAAGVDRVYGGGLCTYGDQRRFFSYRRDGQCGRMASVIFRPAESAPSP